MSLVRWEPFGDVDTLFNRLMPASFTRVALPGNGRKLDWSPSADISETDMEYVIRAELPAVKKEDVQVTYDEGVITIKGERKQQKDEKTEKYHRVESFYGSFERSFSLPENANAETIRCESKDGILTVHIPKTENVQAEAETDHRTVTRSSVDFSRVLGGSGDGAAAACRGTIFPSTAIPLHRQAAKRESWGHGFGGQGTRRRSPRPTRPRPHR